MSYTRQDIIDLCDELCTPEGVAPYSRAEADELRDLALKGLSVCSESTSSTDHYRNGWNEAIDRAALTAECANPSDGRNHDECPFCTSARVIRQLKVPQ